MVSQVIKTAALAVTTALVLSGCNVIHTGMAMAKDKQRRDDQARSQAAAEHERARKEEERKQAEAAQQAAFEQTLADIAAARQAKNAERVTQLELESREKFPRSQHRDPIRKAAQEALAEIEKAAFEQVLADIAAAKKAKDADKVAEIQVASAGKVKQSEYRSKIHVAAAQALVEMGEFDRYAADYMAGSKLGSSVSLATVEQTVPKAKLVPMAKKYFKATKFDKERGATQYRYVVEYLEKSGGLTADLCPSVLRHLKEGNITVGALYTAGELKCKVDANTLADFMVSDSSAERRAAVWTIGQLNLRSMKAKVQSVRYNDPAFENGCTCYPVRDEAAKVLTRFTP